jgi:hypothetical protein
MQHALSLSSASAAEGRHPTSDIDFLINRIMTKRDESMVCGGLFFEIIHRFFITVADSGRLSDEQNTVGCSAGDAAAGGVHTCWPATA